MANNLLAQTTKYFMQGRAYYDGTSQVYKLYLTDDGTGNVTGENISILPDGKILKGPVKGMIDYGRKVIRFQELRLTSLPKGQSEADFCFFTIIGSFKVVEGKTVVQGKFTSKQNDGTMCSGGTIYLIGEKDITNIRAQYLTRIEQKKKAELPKAVVKKIVPKIIKKDSVLTKIDLILTDSVKPLVAEKPNIPADMHKFNYEDQMLAITLQDYHEDDNDQVDVYLNDKIVLSSYTLKTSGFKFDLDIKALGNGTGLDIIKIVCKNDGYYSPNSTKIILDDGKRSMTITKGLSVGQVLSVALQNGALGSN
jgi:hypothetical protein